jgi:hypothetical protein
MTYRKPEAIKVKVYDIPGLTIGQLKARLATAKCDLSTTKENAVLLEQLIDKLEGALAYHKEWSAHKGVSEERTEEEKTT